MYLPPNYDTDPDAFGWPVSRNNIVCVRDRFIQRIIEISQNPREDYHQLYPVLSLLWVNHIIQSYHLLVANSLLSPDEVENYLGGDTGFWQAIHEQKMPEIPGYVSLLERGLPKHNPFLESLRGIKRIWPTKD